MKICVPIKEKTLKGLQKSLQKAEGKADLAEIWLDALSDSDRKIALQSSKLPLLAVCKRKVEQGTFTGSYKEQADILLMAIESGVAYVDIPLFMPEELNKKIVQSAKKAGVKVIISHHDFKKTPSLQKLLEISEKMIKRKADVVKIAVHSNDLEEAIQLIAVAKHLQAKIPHILIGMGQKGILTRILTPTLGGEMMFAVLDKKRQTAQGQMTVAELKKAWSLLKNK